eukprot:TRINITY_DN11940_c0_g1_i2.p1 TRINITY_DN11940_c0_g1~~TRINITY_DN11940_c0_g1_i2.p1  ORF type:complete len:405 (-),score=95.19 TRINITY_DN11940_c0_g1_i2:201-1415(-)
MSEQEDALKEGLQRLFEACADPTSAEMDLNTFSSLMSRYDANLTPDQVSLSFEYLSQGQPTVSAKQFQAWGLSLFEFKFESNAKTCLAGLEELIQLAHGLDTHLPVIPATQLMRMAGSVLPHATAAQFRAALQSSPVLERKAAAALVGLEGARETAAAGAAGEHGALFGSLVPAKGCVHLQRPCSNMCGADAQVFVSVLNAAVCSRCARLITQQPVFRQSRCVLSTTVPAIQPSGVAAVVASTLTELSTVELHETLQQHPSVWAALEQALTMLPLPNLIRKPVKLSGELMKLSTKKAWQMRRVVLSETLLSYYDDQRECWSVPLDRISRIRCINPSVEELGDSSEFMFGVLVTPLDGQEYEKVFRADSCNEQAGWVKSIHINTCLVPKKDRVVPHSVELECEAD